MELPPKLCGANCPLSAVFCMSSSPQQLKQLMFCFYRDFPFTCCLFRDKNRLVKGEKAEFFSDEIEFVFIDEEIKM